MTVTNHAAAGAIIGLGIDKPLLAIPLALLSHFVMDALPHFGYPGHRGFGEALKHRLTYFYLYLDSAGLAFLLSIIADQSWLVYTTTFIAVLPDIWWVILFFGFESQYKKIRVGRFSGFHSSIQWYERPWGLLIEILAGVGLITAVWKLIY